MRRAQISHSNAFRTVCSFAVVFVMLLCIWIVTLLNNHFRTCVIRSEVDQL